MIGSSLGPYEIVALLGKGGMGEVYRARDPRLGREVALKVLPPDMAGDADRLERFEREARAVAALSHPNIVHLYSVEEADGVRFLTMELVEGRSLEDVLDEGPLPRGRLLAVGEQVADALAAAHARGIVHRDLKPGNILLDTAGRVKVLDFGLAKLSPAGDAEADHTQALTLTRAGGVLGTVPYMSPEQLRGREVDARSDVFSLGVLLYELAAGRRPFGGESQADLTSAILRESPPPLAETSVGAPAGLEAVLSRCLEKEPQDRYQSVADLRNDLRALARGETTAGSSGVRADGNAAGGKPARAGRRVAMGLVAVAVVALAAVGILRGIGGAPVRAQAKTVAVLPFDNLSPGEDDAYFAVGVHEDVMSRLGSLDGLTVISRTSVRRFAGQEGGLPEIGRRLGAAYIVEGAVRRQGDQVRVTAQLFDAATDRSLWTATFDRELRDVFAVQAEIAREIAATLETRIGRGDDERLDAVPTTDMAAYDEYLRARDLMHGSWLPYPELERAIGMLETATAADPGFLEAWALLSRARSDQVERLREFDDREDETDAAAAAARDALDRARDLDAEHVSTLKAQGVYSLAVEENTADALRALDRALAVGPEDSGVLRYQAEIYFDLGQTDDFVDAMERAYAVDAANPGLVFFLTVAYELCGRYADAVPFLERLAELEPERTHYVVQAKYFQFLADGSLESFHAFEDAVRSVERTEQCNVRTVLNREMIVAMVNGEFDRYARAWEGKWDRHHAGHGNWACPAQINEEANHARLLLERGDTEGAGAILQRARESTTRPYDENSFCIFDKAAFSPKLEYLAGNPDEARRDLEAAIPRILANDEIPRGPVERAVLVQTADLVMPDRVYDLYRDVSSRPASFLHLETVCADPWTYPNLVRDPRFRGEVEADGRFVEFLEHYGLPAEVGS